MSQTQKTPMHTVRYGYKDEREVASVEVTRSFDAAVEEVWAALTSTERLSRWFARVTGSLEPGGSYQVEGNASGVVEQCHPPRGFRITWEHEGAHSWVEVEVAELAETRTVVRISHTGPTATDHWRTFGPAAAGLGWDLAVVGLAMHLADGGGDVTEAGLAWAAAPVGIAYVRACGEGWEQADVAAGGDEPQARTRAAASVAFYTGDDSTA